MFFKISKSINDFRFLQKKKVDKILIISSSRFFKERDDYPQ